MKKDKAAKKQATKQGNIEEIAPILLVSFMVAGVVLRYFRPPFYIRFIRCFKKWAKIVKGYLVAG